MAGVQLHEALVGCGMITQGELRSLLKLRRLPGRQSPGTSPPHPLHTYRQKMIVVASPRRMTWISGVVFPQTEIGPDPKDAKELIQATEQMGFEGLVVYDHVVGANTDFYKKQRHQLLLRHRQQLPRDFRAPGLGRRHHPAHQTHHRHSHPASTPDHPGGQTSGSDRRIEWWPVWFSA